jgi:hypothetical protein
MVPSLARGPFIRADGGILPQAERGFYQDDASTTRALVVPLSEIPSCRGV